MLDIDNNLIMTDLGGFLRGVGILELCWNEQLFFCFVDGSYNIMIFDELKWTLLSCL